MSNPTETANPHLLLRLFVFVVGGALAYVLTGAMGVVLVIGIVTAGFVAEHIRYHCKALRQR